MSSAVKVSSIDTFSLSLLVWSQMVTLTQLSRTCKLFSPERLNAICNNGLLLPFIFNLENDVNESFLELLSPSSAFFRDSIMFATPLFNKSLPLLMLVVDSDVLSAISFNKKWNSFRIKSLMNSSMLSVSVERSILCFSFISSVVVLKLKKIK